MAYFPKLATCLAEIETGSKILKEKLLIICLTVSQNNNNNYNLKWKKKYVFDDFESITVEYGIDRFPV